MLRQFLSIPIIYHGARNQKKINNPFTEFNTELLMDRQTDRQAENSSFIGPSIGQGSKKSNLEQNATLIEEEKIIAN